MNRVQQNECLVQLPNKISPLPECVPELFWLVVSKCRECICLLKFRASFQILRVWVECIKYPAVYPKWRIVPGNDTYLSFRRILLQRCDWKWSCPHLNELHWCLWQDQIFKSFQTVPQSSFANGVTNFHDFIISLSALASITCGGR